MSKAAFLPGFALAAPNAACYTAPVFRRSSAVEQLTVNQLVVGSIPTAGAKNPRFSKRLTGAPYRLLIPGVSLFLSLVAEHFGALVEAGYSLATLKVMVTQRFDKDAPRADRLLG